MEEETRIRKPLPYTENSVRQALGKELLLFKAQELSDQADQLRELARMIPDNLPDAADEGLLSLFYKAFRA
jgi:hypothetical protein